MPPARVAAPARSTALRGRPGPLGLGLLLGLLLAGCGAGTSVDRAAPAEPAPGDHRTAPPAPSPSPGGQDGEERRPRPGRVVASHVPTPAAPSVPVRLLGRWPALLGADDLGSGWSTTGTGPERGRLVSDCQRASLVDIGARSSRMRSFAAGGSSARHAVAEFADARSAWRAERVVAAWVDDCAADLAARTAALGTVRRGDRLSVVEVEEVARPNAELRRLRPRLRAGLG